MVNILKLRYSNEQHYRNACGESVNLKLNHVPTIFSPPNFKIKEFLGQGARLIFRFNRKLMEYEYSTFYIKTVLHRF